MCTNIVYVVHIIRIFRIGLGLINSNQGRTALVNFIYPLAGVLSRFGELPSI